jgi:hypothetical protein
MKPRPILKSISALLLVVCCFVSSSVFAHTPHAREAHAAVQSIDYQKQILTLTYAKESGPQKLHWRPDTQFLRDLKPMPVTELKEGTQVTVSYHSPFFGKPFAIKVVWQSI